jgi:bifunctional DNA-binding transcriptional regulator/antitoxin component of YhaV-PrlF toxin-antitoxin module
MSESNSHNVVLGSHGSFVIPAQVRARHGWDQGISLVSLDTESGLLIMSVGDALELLRSRLSGRDLVAELFADRKSEVSRESA